METNAAALEDHLGYWLRLVSNSVSAAFAEKLAARGVSVAEWVMLRLLFDQSCAPSDLAARMGVTRGAVTKMAERLIERGLVLREALEADRRYQALSLTRAGRALTPRLAALADKNETEFFGSLKPQERATLERTLRAIAAKRGLSETPLE